MDRMIVYPGAIPLDTDVLNVERFMMSAIGFLAQATLGTGTVVDGLSCTQQTVPNLTVQIAPGSIISLQTVDANSFGSLLADTTDPLVKMGINPSIVQSTTLGTISAPGTTGQSINYLIQAAFQESDTSSIVLPYYNSSNPAAAYSGPGNSGTAQNTQRIQRVNLGLKAGTAATTGTQVTPTPDGGFVGLWVITVAFGQSTIVNANIARYSSAPLANEQTGSGTRGGRLINIQVFKTPGTFTYNATPGTNLVDVEVQGAGGTGAGSPATSTGQTSQGGHGGAGSYARKLITSSFNGVTITVGASSSTTGTNGGSSSFGAIVSAAGGNAGLQQAATSATSYVVSNPAAAALPTTGDVNVQGATPGANFTISGNSITNSRAWSMFNGSWGAGGSSNLPNGASQAANGGIAGGGGIVIVREYS